MQFTLYLTYIDSPSKQGARGTTMDTTGRHLTNIWSDRQDTRGDPPATRTRLFFPGFFPSFFRFFSVTVTTVTRPLPSR